MAATPKCKNCDDEFERRGTWQKLCPDCWRKRRTVEGHTYSASKDGGHYHPIEPELLTDLIKLCHPDHHPEDRQEMANRATAALLDMKKKAS